MIYVPQNGKEKKYIKENTNEKVLIPGVIGQDGAYLSEFLLKKDMSFG